MPTEDRRNQKKIQCWVSISTWEQLEAMGYSSQTVAVNEGFEKLLEGSKEYPRESQDIPILKARLEEKDKQIEEKDRHIETLKKDLDISQETHKNYMVQVQTLINQKAIEAPGEKKKPFWKFW